MFVVDSGVVGFDADLGRMTNNPTMITTTTAAVIPIMSPVGFLRDEVVGGMGKGCAARL